ncbi:MAG: TraY domain-containing protein [Acidobacteria bacterium]|nr:TraY domain-containing protein [Acidobacteriota bacterium]
MISIRLNPAIEDRLTQLSKKTARTKTFYAKQLIENHLDDLEDRCLAESRLECRQPAMKASQFKKALGVGHS